MGNKIPILFHGAKIQQNNQLYKISSKKNLKNAFINITNLHKCRISIIFAPKFNSI